SIDDVTRDASPGLGAIDHRLIDLGLPAHRGFDVTLFLENPEKRADGARGQGDVRCEEVLDLGNGGWAALPEDFHQAELAVSQDGRWWSGHGSRERMVS